MRTEKRRGPQDDCHPLQETRGSIFSKILFLTAFMHEVENPSRMTVKKSYVVGWRDPTIFCIGSRHPTIVCTGSRHPNYFLSRTCLDCAILP